MFVKASEALVDEAITKLVDAPPPVARDTQPTGDDVHAEDQDEDGVSGETERREADPPPRTRPPAASGDLTDAWKRLSDAHELLALVHEILGDEWEIAEGGKRIVGPCPRGEGKCATEPRSAFIYTRSDGGPPYVCCGHKNSCAFKKSLFDVVADHLGSRVEAAKTIKDAARITTAKLDEKASTERENLASKLVEVFLESGVELWAPPGEDVEGYASLVVDGHRESWRVRSKKTRDKLTRLCRARFKKTPSGQVLTDTVNALEAEAVEGSRYPVYQRLGSDGADIYLDLGQPDWSAVKINQGGWEVVTLPVVRFVRSAGMKPLPVPVRGGKLSELRGFVNVGSDEDFLLLLSWIVAALRPKGPFPVLCLHGEHGSAKSTTSTLLRDLVDPNVSALRAEPREVRDLMVAAKRAWAVSFDNLSSLPVWLSDALCRLATGGGFSTRQLFTDDDEVLFDVQRPVILNGIEDLATRGDLLDRAVIVRLPAIPDERRRDEEEYKASFEAARPRILGALLDAVATGLRRLPDVKLEKKPRLADFAKWIAAVEPAFGCAPGEALDAYLNNRRMANDLALEADPIVQPLRELVESSGGAWTGTASALWKELKARSDDEARRQRGWPKAANVLSGNLRRLAPNLRAIGISYRQDRETSGTRRRLIVLTATERSAEASRSDQPDQQSDVA